jgi:hypothetical protein
MIAMSPMFEAMPGFVTTAKNYWFGKKGTPTTPERPERPMPSPSERIMTAAKKATSEGEGGVGGSLRRMMNRRSLLAQAAE